MILNAGPFADFFFARESKLPHSMEVSNDATSGRVTCNSGFDWTHEQQASALRYLRLSSIEESFWQVPSSGDTFFFLTKSVRHCFNFFKLEGIQGFSPEIWIRRASATFQISGEKTNFWISTSMFSTARRGHKTSWFFFGANFLPRWTARPQKRILPGLWPPLHALWGEEKILGRCCWEDIVGWGETMWNGETLHFVFKSKRSLIMRLDSKSDLWFDMIGSETMYIHIYI